MSDRSWENLSREALAMLLTGDDPLLIVLRRQLAASTSAIAYTGAGLVLTFTTPRNVPLLMGNPSMTISGVAGTLLDSKEMVIFVLFVRDGLLQMLDVFTTEGVLPDPHRVTLQYENSDLRQRYGGLG